jgi:hypothetical protein
MTDPYRDPRDAEIEQLKSTLSYKEKLVSNMTRDLSNLERKKMTRKQSILMNIILSIGLSLMGMIVQSACCIPKTPSFKVNKVEVKKGPLVKILTLDEICYRMCKDTERTYQVISAKQISDGSFNYCRCYTNRSGEDYIQYRIFDSDRKEVVTP